MPHIYFHSSLSQLHLCSKRKWYAYGARDHFETMSHCFHLPYLRIHCVNSGSSIPDILCYLLSFATQHLNKSDWFQSLSN